MKTLLIIFTFSISLNLFAQEPQCPENYMWVDYHNSCMAIPPTPVCPEGEIWIEYHNACMASAPITN